MKDQARFAALLATLAFALAGCGDDTTPTPVDQGGDPDHGPVDQGTNPDQDTTPTCDGPPGLYVDGSCTELAAGVRPFRPRFELWSDAATKERFVFIPDNGVIDTSDPNGWIFPVGTVFWKTFSRGGRRLETRILTKVSAGAGMDSWTFVAYGWNQAQDDVTLIGVNGLQNVLGTTHDIPSREDCLTCHASAASDVGLGFGAVQLADALLPLSLDDLAAAAEMSDPIAIADARVPGTTVQRNALGYLHANCAHCHGGSSPLVGLNMELVTGLTSVCETNTYLSALAATDNMLGGCDTPGTDSFWGAPTIKRVAPGETSMSAVYLRMNTRVAGNQMPPLGTEDPDDLGLMAIQQWITSGVPHVP